LRSARQVARLRARKLELNQYAVFRGVDSCAGCIATNYFALHKIDII
jgi:hypothetical protein